MSQIGDFMVALLSCGSFGYCSSLFGIFVLSLDASALDAGKPSRFPLRYASFRAIEYASHSRRFAGLLSLALWPAGGNAVVQIGNNAKGARIDVCFAIAIS
jgi:hypothetical protein